jgi:cardiolipin hydrolase
MEFVELDARLRASVTDLKLDNAEKLDLRQAAAALGNEHARYLRNHAFDITRELMLETPGRTLEALQWLEQVVKTVDAAQAPPATVNQAWFAPGDACLRKLRELMGSARTSVDVCVFTISDDRLSGALIDCHARGVAVRILSDNDKRFDDGSDIAHLHRAGIPVHLDNGPEHMHHKFAVFDGRVLANGSFNWTRSATERNEENLVVTDDPALVGGFSGRFEALWQAFPALVD